MSVLRLESKFYNEVGNTPHNEYPRPQLERDSFVNLNGKWKFAILDKTENFEDYDKEILVPFSPECLLSGLSGIEAKPTDVLYYNRTFELKKEFVKDRTFIHFGAVDYASALEINGKLVGEFTSGYFPVSLEVTKFVKAGKNEISLKITDPCDTGTQARAKQKTKHGGIWYTPQSGIWQTVWLESVPKVFVKSMTIVPDIDKGKVSVKLDIEGKAQTATVEMFDGKKQIAKADVKNGEAMLSPKDFECWSPENPKLYDLVITVDEDVVKSYCGMRKFSIMTDEKGIKRLALNNKPYFHNGVLDQGYWSDGMLTPPTDSAMIYDIQLMKDMGFNMLRKHIKIEPLRWYYHCDRLGMIVWQDMVSGGGSYNMLAIGILPFVNIKVKDTKQNYKFLGREDKAGRDEYYKDLKTMVEYLKNTVSLGVWVPFNEGWGQFESVKATEFVKELDSTRVIDSVSGWNDQGKGSSDLKSLHVYFKPIKIPRDSRCVVLSEFGGYSIATEGHMFNPSKLFGYRIYKKPESFAAAYQKLFEKRILPLIDKGLSATVYTQLSDVEEEINGYITYDRKVVKLPIEMVKAVNSKIKL